MTKATERVAIRQERLTGRNVVEEAEERLHQLYREGHRVVCSVSGGKDSTVVMELAARVAMQHGKRLEVVMRDDEVALPGTYEYCERVRNSRNGNDLDYHWVAARQPIINVFNRDDPFWWCFDPLLDPSQWIRTPPDYVEWIPELELHNMINTNRFPPEEGKKLVVLTGIRANESSARRAGIHSTGGYMTKHPVHGGAYLARVIYDWTDGDVWRAILTGGDSGQRWDYSHAYDAMLKMGQRPRALRTAPPTMNSAGIRELRFASQLWPQWYDRVCQRCPGIRTAVLFGDRAVKPQRRLGETWEQCFWRTCVEDAPGWISERAKKVAAAKVRHHGSHSGSPLPDKEPCMRCNEMIKSWRQMALSMFMGDPFSQKQGAVPQVEPEYFRPGAGRWYS